MAGVTAHGGTFTFTPVGGAPLTAYVTGLSVESPQAVCVDMTAWDTAHVEAIAVVATGEWTGGSASVDYIHAGGAGTVVDPQTIVRKAGVLQFASPGHSVTRNAILESASTQAAVGDLVRGTLKFRFTDYLG